MDCVTPDPPVNPEWVAIPIGTGDDDRFYPITVLQNPHEDLRRHLSCWRMNDGERAILRAALNAGIDIPIFVELCGNAFKPSMYPGMRVIVGQPSSAYIQRGDGLGQPVPPPPDLSATKI
jgi:hypothetical protein